jgi:hypothetical protein
MARSGGLWQIAGILPDVQHGLILNGMPGMGIAPLLEPLTLLLAAVLGMQTHAPMRSGIGDGVLFGFREQVCGHGIILISRILTLREVGENNRHGNYPSICPGACRFKAC